MNDITGQINAKRLGKTGLTDDILTRIADQESGELVVVATVQFEDLHKKRDGSRKVSLTIKEIEPATEQLGEEHLRGVQRAMFLNRKLTGEDPTLPIDSAGDVEPTVAEVMAKGRQFTPHEFEEDETVTDDFVCVVCGNVEDHVLHQPADEADVEPDQDAA